FPARSSSLPRNIPGSGTSFRLFLDGVPALFEDMLCPVLLNLQIAFAFFYSVFQGYAPDTDLDNVRNRVVGILFGLIVTGLVFRYIWPERARIEPRTAQQ